MSADYPSSNRNKVKRIPKRGHYDKDTIYAILDQDFVCHLGFVANGQPFVIPTAYGRDGDTIYLHGATTSRLLTELQKGIPACMTVTLLDGIVAARSAFHSSMNYRSVVAFGKAKLIENAVAKGHALFVISEQILKGRWDEARAPIAKELKATSVLALEIEEASAKIRTGPPGDDQPDYNLPIWAGVIPIERRYGMPVPDPVLPSEIPLSKSTFNVHSRGGAIKPAFELSRPTGDEYANFYQNYISLVPDGHIIDILKQQQYTIHQFFKDIPDHKWDYRYAPDKWSIKQVLLHLIDTERVMAYRALRIGRGDQTELPGFEQNDFANYAAVDHLSKNDLLEEYRCVRQSTIRMFEHFEPAVFKNMGTASHAPVSTLALAYIIAGHELHHIRVLRSRYF